MKTYSKLKAGVAPAALGLAMIAMPAFAQDASATPQAAAADDVPQQQIIVTGSRIVRKNLETAAPIAVVTNEEFKLSGTVNVEQVINTLPQVLPGTTSFSNNPGGGVATLNLRGLGSNRTLVLVNGRRWMFFDTSQVTDLNTIPAFLLNGVDVVTGGASAVYGSDAIAGVVNFRLRNLQGVEVGSQYSLTGRGDGARYEGYMGLGSEFADGKGHATVFAEYYRRQPILQGARDFSAAVLNDDGAGGFRPGGSSTTPFGRFTSTLSTAACPAGNVFCSPGALYETPGVSRKRVPTDLYNFGAVNDLQVPQERFLAGAYGDYDIGNGHTAYTEVTFVNNRVDNVLAATPVTGTFQVKIATVAPFISANDVAALKQLDAVASSTNVVGDGIVPLAIQRRVTETGGRISHDERNAYRILTGLKGPITSNISYDVNYMYARTRNSNVQNGNVSRSAFQNGLNGTASAINIFGPDTLTPAMVTQISIAAQNANISVLQVGNAAISGSLLNLGMGGDDVGFAFGGEYRKVNSEFIPDTALSSGDVIGFNAGLPTKGGYNVKEGFAELRVPIAANKPGIARLELNAAARYSKYSLGKVGGVWTYAAGAEYAPIRDVMFRAQYQRAVRAPNVSELFGGQSQNFPTAIDPCSLASAASNATIKATCIATGVPSAAVGTAGLQLNTQIQDTVGGNPNLSPEISDSYTAGVVIRPSMIPGLSLTADYFNIKVKGAIGTLGGGLANSLNLCYNVIQNVNSIYCQAFVGTRNALGQFDGVKNPLILNANTSLFKVEGVDFELNYATRAPFHFGKNSSKINFNFLGTYTRHSIGVPVQELPNQSYECAGQFGILNCGNPTPKWKWVSRLSYIEGPVTMSVRWQHLSSVIDDDTTTTYTVEKIGSYDTFDLSLNFAVNETFEMSVGVNNLADRQPPILGSNQEQANTYPGTYNPLGRDFFVSGRLKF